MARADLLCELIKKGLLSDKEGFIKITEAICAEERAKQHIVLAQKIEEILKIYSKKEQTIQNKKVVLNGANGNVVGELLAEKIPQKRLTDLMLSPKVVAACNELIEESLRADILRSYGLEPRNKILLYGPPGNGKTTLAEAIAEALMVPMYTVKYESIVGAYLGETASKLSRLFDFVKTRPCLLFFDEFETLGKERGDERETGEIKRVVSSLLLQIDALPSYVIFVAATNHEELLDTAAWRRFQIKLELLPPSRRNIEIWLLQFEKKNEFKFGYEATTLAKKLLGKGYAEIEEFALATFRQYILRSPTKSSKAITSQQLQLLLNSNIEEGGVE